MTEREIEQWFADHPNPSVDYGSNYTTFINEVGDSITVTIDDNDGELVWEQGDE